MTDAGKTKAVPSMDKSNAGKALGLLILADVLVLGVVTVIGFASHGTVGTAGARMLTTFVPLVVAWFMVAPLLGAYDLGRAREALQLWRPFWAMVLAAPMAAWLRGVWLNAPIQPVFVAVLGGVGAVSLLAWRALYLFVRKR